MSFGAKGCPMGTLWMFLVSIYIYIYIYILLVLLRIHKDLFLSILCGCVTKCCNEFL